MAPQLGPAERSDTIPEHRRRDRSGDNPGNWYRADDVDAGTYTVAEAAAKLRVGLKLAYEMARTGQIPTIRLGRRILVPRAALEAMLNGGAR